tara:strand:+ start:4 stop:2001 length:1998 start_codon:yes stop_codon:yes gene_type:complete
MATTVDTLLIRIEADMSDLKRDLARVTSQTEKQTQRMADGFKRVRNAVLALGGGALFGNFVKDSIQTGASIEALRVQLEGLLGSAEQGSLAFDKMSKFAAQVPFSLAEIQAGSGSLAATASDADELGELLQITGNIAAQFGIPFSEAAANVQRAMSAGAGAADQFRDRGVLAFAGFEQGVSYSGAETARKLIENFGTGGKADGAMAEFAKTTGGALSMFQDAMFNFKGAMAESGLNEGFKEFLNVITDIIKESGSLASTIGGALGGAFSGLADAIIFLRSIMSPIVDVLTSMASIIATTFHLLNEAFGEPIQKAMDAVSVALGFIQENLQLILIFATGFAALRLFDLFFDIGRSASIAARGLFAAAMSKNFLTSAIKKGMGALVILAFFLTKITGTSDDLVAALDKLGQELLNALPPELRDQVTSFSQELLDASGAIKDAFKSLRGEDTDLVIFKDQDPSDAVNNTVAAIQAALAAVETGTDGIVSATQTMTDHVNSALSSFSASVSSSFVETMAMGGNFAKSFENLFNDLVKTIIAKAIELFVVNQIMNSIFGGVTGFSPLPSGQLFGAAGGGTIQPNTPTLVGERGPELFVPSGAGKIMNNMNTQNALGGGGVTVNQTINVETGVSQTVRAEMLSLLPVIKQDTLNAVADSSRRGGSFRQALA